MWKQLIAAICLLSLSAGPIVGQKQYQRRGLQTPDIFRAGESFGRNQASIGDLKWFEVFKDEELQGLIRTAIIQNYDLAEAAARINAARANLGLARSDQFPQFTVSADDTITRFSQNSFSIGGLGQVLGKTQSIGEVLLNLLSFEVDIWGRLRNQTKAARAELKASEEDRRAAMTTVVGDVASAYFSLLELDGELDIARRTLATREESLKLIKTREQGGIATMLDVRQGEQLVYQAAETIPQTQQFIEQTENQINLLIGNNPGPIRRGRLLTQQEELPDVPPGLPSALLERRPDIRSAEQILISRNALIKAARASYFPTISLTGLIGFQSDQLSNLFSTPSRSWTFVPEVTQPIFTAGRLKSNVRLARADQELAVAIYRQTIQTAFREVSDALIAYQKVKEVRVQQELLVSTLKDRASLAYLRYDGGVDTLLNALDADRDLFDAELSLNQTKRNELLSLVQLYKALGGGWQ